MRTALITSSQPNILKYANFFHLFYSETVHVPTRQADAITGFMHKSGENRQAAFSAAKLRGSVATAAQEAAEITGVR